MYNIYSIHIFYNKHSVYSWLTTPWIEIESYPWSLRFPFLISMWGWYYTHVSMWNINHVLWRRCVFIWWSPLHRVQTTTIERNWNPQTKWQYFIAMKVHLNPPRRVTIYRHGLNIKWRHVLWLITSLNVIRLTLMIHGSCVMFKTWTIHQYWRVKHTAERWW